MKPLVSVIIPSFNHERYLEQAIQSVLEQSHARLEIIVIDDGSTDRSLEVARGLRDDRLQVHAQPNQGAHATLNRGLHMARGEYIALLNSDDRFAPTRIERLLRACEERPRPVLVCSHIEVIDADDRQLGVKRAFENHLPRPAFAPDETFQATGHPALNLLGSNYIATTSNMLFKRFVFERIGGFRPYRYTHDWDFALRAASRGDLAIVPEPLISYRLHAHNTINENEERMILEICATLACNLGRVLHKHGQVLPEGELARRLLHSLELYDCEEVLLMMLALFAATGNEDALIAKAVDPEGELAGVFLPMIRKNARKRPAWRHWMSRVRTMLRAS